MASTRILLVCSVADQSTANAAVLAAIGPDAGPGTFTVGASPDAAKALLGTAPVTHYVASFDGVDLSQAQFDALFDQFGSTSAKAMGRQHHVVSSEQSMEDAVPQKTGYHVIRVNTLPGQ
jgi:hypothetical protein